MKLSKALFTDREQQQMGTQLIKGDGPEITITEKSKQKEPKRMNRNPNMCYTRSSQTWGQEKVEWTRETKPPTVVLNIQYYCIQ